MSGKNRVRSDKERPRGYNNRLRRFLWWSLFVFISSAVMIIDFFPAQVSVEVGEPANEDIYFNGNTTSYISDIRTVMAENIAAAAVEPVYRIDNQPLTALIALIANNFSQWAILAENKDMEQDAKLDAAWRVLDLDRQAWLTATEENQILRLGKTAADIDKMLLAVLQCNRDQLNNIRAFLQNSIMEIIQPGVTEDELVKAVAQIRSNIEKAEYDEQISALLLFSYDRFAIAANKFYDGANTELARQEAIAAVPPVSITVKTGELIVSKGSLVNDLQIEALLGLGLLQQGNRMISHIGIVVIIVMFYVMLIMYARRYYPRTRGREANIVLIGVLFNIILFAAKLLSMIPSASSEFVLQIGFLLPVAAMSMILTILLGQGIAIFVTLFMSLCAGMIFPGGVYCSFVAVVGGLMGVFCSGNVNQRGQFVNASVYIAGVNMVMITAVNLITEQSYNIIAVGLGFGLLNGLFSAILTMGILPFFESGFKITTSVKLMELANSNHPLLKRLMMEAPGTYHHSVLVGNLAETAADAIGADPLLVRVASYYHDIGKIKRPIFFIENQQGHENPHDKLQPSLSALIITSHVKDGVDILREHKFPQEIIDAVKMHHGTGLLSFFYNKAKEAAENPDSVRKEDYCYGGPLPSTKEMALVSLADSVQAAVKALNSDDNDLIEQRVRSVINSRIEEGQLNESPLTLKDLEAIVRTFAIVLTGVNHSRIEYPEQIIKQDTDNKTDKKGTEKRVNAANTPKNSK